MVQRLCYRRHNHYNTKSNKVFPVRTPGNKLLFHYKKKRSQVPRCNETKQRLPGMPGQRPWTLRKTSKCQRRVSRAYGGNKSHKAVRDRILRAFLCEEQRCVKAVYLERERQHKTAEAIAAKKAAAKKSKKSSKKAE